MFLLAVTVFLWRGMLTTESGEIRRTVESRADEVKQMVERELGERRRSLERIALRIGNAAELTPESWARRETVYLEHFPALKQLTWRRPDGESATLSADGWTSTESELSGATGSGSRVRLDTERNVLLMSVPVPDSDPGERITAAYSLNTFFEDLLSRVAPLMRVAVRSREGTELYVRGGDAGEAASGFQVIREIRVNGESLTTETVPSSTQLARIRTTMPVLVFGLGILFSLLGGAMVRLWMLARRRENEAERINSRLRREMEQRQWAERELEKSNAQLEQFAYTASHDLQEPLRSVKSFADLLDQKYHDQLPEEAREYLDFITDGAQRMKTLINDLLQLSRLQRRELELETVPAEEVVEHALQNLYSAIEESKAEVQVGELGEVRADPEQLAMVFQNLISNGIKFSQEGEQPLIKVTAEHRGTEVEFSVEDNGIGIEPEYREQIFRVFQRLHGRDDYEGTGLGLAICKQIVERHGGKIRVDSGSLQGSRFYFTISKG